MIPSYLITGTQSRMARSLLKWSREKLAEEANVSRGTIRTFEEDQPIRESIIIEIQSIFDANGVDCGPDGSVKPSVNAVKTFEGMGASDRFFANMEKTAKEKGILDITCRIGNQDILSRSSGRDHLSNFERLENVNKSVPVRCLLSDQKLYMPGKPSFEVRVFPERRPNIIASEFVYGEDIAFVVEQDMRITVASPSYTTSENVFASTKMRKYFNEDWNEAEPYMKATQRGFAHEFDSRSSYRQARC